MAYEIYIRKKRPYTAEEETDRILEEVAEIAKELGTTLFLWDGTCLGFYRDGAYLVADGDIDIGIICSEEKQKEFIQELRSKGYTALGESTKRFVKNDLWLDFYFSSDTRLEKYKKYIENLTHLHYKGIIYRIPYPVEEYLKEVYGDDWKTRKTYFIERFPVPTEKTNEEIYAIIGGQQPQLFSLKKGLELVKLTKLDVDEDER